MNKPVTSELADATLVNVTQDVLSGIGPLASAEPLFELPPGEAQESLRAVHRVLDNNLPSANLAIYEAGGGSTSPLPCSVMKRAHITVVDNDAEQLRGNDYAHENTLGDIQSHRFASESFDLVICYNVIEHLPDVQAALLGFCGSLKQGGLILIGAPNPRSLSGVVTKYTPHWFHIWFYRHFLGDKDAGQPGHAPFPTFFHPLVTPTRLEAFAKDQGLRVIYKKTYESPRFPEMRQKRPALALLLDAAATVMNLLLPGKADVRRGDYHMILQRR
jgi:SAM-dependent methyltransferase